MKQRLFYFVLFTSLLGFGGCNSSGESSGGINTGDFVVTSPYAEVAAKMDKFVEVSVTVNGVPGNFILDTGADSFLVSPEFAVEAGLDDSGTVNIVTIAGISETEVRRIEHFQFGSIEGYDIDAAVVDLAGFDGAIGKPLLEHALVSIDFVNEVISLGDPSISRLSTMGSNFQLLSANNLELPEIAINSQILRDVRLDTGNAGGVILSDPEVGQELLADAELSVATTVTATNGSLDGTAMIADTLSIGSAKLEDQFVVVVDLPDQNSDVAAKSNTSLLGNLVLKQFVVGIDMSRGELLLVHVRSLSYGLSNGGLRGVSLFQEVVG
ncbi:MAG: aspartyl protease family protein [Deltaproteobacteria bacterium]|nr:aspartyl protease family protein [Deltaproteobacteria bacterium]